MNDRDLQDWLDRHGGELSRHNNEKTVNPIDPQTQRPTGETTTKVDSITIVANDRATITIRRNPGSNAYQGPVAPDRPDTYQESPSTAQAHSTYEVVGTEVKPGFVDTRSPEETAVDTDKAAQSAQVRREAEWNRDNGPGNSAGNGKGSGYYETHAARAEREQRAAEQVRQEQASQIQQDAAQRAQRNEERQTSIDERTATQQAEANRQGQERIDEEVRSHKAEENRANRPSVIGSSTDTSKNVAIFDPSTGDLRATPNPAYDQAKDDAARERERITLELEAGRMKLDEAKQAYTQWFDTNIKLPFMQADEARSQASDSRAALAAEDRRKEFAADFGLRKATLGQKAGQDADQNEIALLPYRAGPTEAADMSSAITGLAHGGVPGGPAADAGIHFQASDFQFNAPDFKKIAAQATQAAVGHLTNYRPAAGSYATANYGGITLPNSSTVAPPAVPSVTPSVYQYPSQPQTPGA